MSSVEPPAPSVGSPTPPETPRKSLSALATLAAVKNSSADPYASRERHHNEGHGRRLTAAFEALEAFPMLAESRNRVLRLFEAGEPSTADVVAAGEAFLATLSAEQRATAQVELTPQLAVRCTNFPGASGPTLTAAQNLYALLTGRVSSFTSEARINEQTGQYAFLGPSVQRARMLPSWESLSTSGRSASIRTRMRRRCSWQARRPRGPGSPSRLSMSVGGFRSAILI